MSEDYEDESEPQTQAEDVRTEDEDEGGVPAMSLQDIELLTKNTEVCTILSQVKLA